MVVAWVQRPDQVRVEDIDGTLLVAESGSAASSSSSGLWGWCEEEPQQTIPPEVRAHQTQALEVVAHLAQPQPGEDPGQTVWRARQEAERRYQEQRSLLPQGWFAQPPLERPGDAVPFVENYHWIALLEPDELADGTPVEQERGDDWASLTREEQLGKEAEWTLREAEQAAAIARGDASALVAAPARYEQIRQVQHYGRSALEAELSTLPTYNPRCGCCPLLPGRHADEPEYRDDYPERIRDAVRFRVRLDRATGICVQVETLDGPGGIDFCAEIQEHDVHYPPELFGTRR